jgi:protein SCO1/2
MRIRVARSTAIAAMVAAIVGVVILQPVRASSRWGADYWPNVTLTTQDGKQVKFYDDLLKGKIVAIDLIYTQCKDSCPLETARLRQVQRMLGDRVGKDIFFYSISIDPKHDTPEVLHDYAEMYNAGPGWYFLTGKEEDITLISKKLGLYSADWGRDGHTPSLMVGNVATGQWMRQAATDNPRFLATMIGDFIGDNGSTEQQTAQRKDYSQVTTVKMNGPGHYLFATRCAACHSIGNGDKIGPDLAGITKVREHDWLVRMIGKPDDMLDNKDPIATALYERYKHVRMPNLRLGDGDVAALIDYLRTQDTDAKSSAISTPAAKSEQAKK